MEKIKRKETHDIIDETKTKKSKNELESIQNDENKKEKVPNKF